MKYLLAFILLSLLNFQALWAQAFQTSAAIEYADLGYSFVIGRIENKAFVLSRKAARSRSQYYLTAFDATGLGQIWQKEVALGKDVEQILKVWTKDELLHILAHQYANGRSEIRYIQYDGEGQLLKMKSLFQIDGNNGLNAQQNIQLSEDATKVGLACNWNRQSNWLGVYDLKGDYLLWSSESKIAIEKDAHVDIQRLCIANSGDLYLTLEDKYAESYIYHIQPEEGAPLIYTLGVQDIALSEPKMSYNNQNNSLYIIFFLQQRGNYAYGVQYLRLTKEGALFRHKEIFKEEFVLQTTSKKKAAKRGIYALEVDNIYFQGEEVLVVGEQFMQSSINRNNGGEHNVFYPSNMPVITAFNTTDYDYWYGALVLLKYKNDIPFYQNIIKKEQSTINDRGLLGSYILYKGQGAYTFLYSKIVRHKWHIETYTIGQDHSVKSTVFSMPAGLSHIVHEPIFLYGDKGIYLLGADGKDIHLLKFNLQKTVDYVD